MVSCFGFLRGVQILQIAKNKETVIKVNKPLFKYLKKLSDILNSLEGIYGGVCYYFPFFNLITGLEDKDDHYKLRNTSIYHYDPMSSKNFQ
jgi:hypothetical protein